MCVHATLMRQDKNGERLIVHLFNDANSTAHHALPVDDVPLREETVPIHDIVDGWIGKFERSRLQALGELKKALEARDERE